jgi:hypothetical protein
MKKGWAVLSAIACLTALVPAYAATTSSQPSMFQTEISVQGSVTSKPSAFAKNGTTYMPIWYVMQALDKFGVKTDWNGHDWKMALQKDISIDTGSIKPGTGAIHMYLNGTLVQQVDGIVAKDPSSRNDTTYLPVWYVMHTLAIAKVVSGWDGKTWTLTQPTTPSSGDGGSGGTGTTGGTGSTGDTGGTGGTGSSGGTDGTGAGGTGTGGSTTPPIVVVPQPPLPPNEVAKYQYLSSLFQLMGISPDPSGESPYDDIAATDPNWGYVHSAIEQNLLTPMSSTHSGAYAAMTLAEADQVYWNAFGMSHASYQPGSDPFDWANIIGFNPSGESATTDISPTDEQMMFAHMANFAKGYVQNGGSYQVVYKPQDEYQATFVGDVDGTTGQPYFPTASSIQQAITKTYQFFDGTSFVVNGSDLIVTIPGTVNTNWFAFAATAGEIQYSTNGGLTYSSSDVFDSRQLAGGTAPSTILLKVNAANGISLSFNQLLPDFGGTVSLGDITISDNGGVVSVTRNNLNS